MHNAAKALSVETIHCLASALWDERHFQSGKGRRRTAIFHSTDALVPDDANVVESFSRSENARVSLGFTSSHTCVEIRRQREILFPSETDLKFSYNCLLFLASGKVAVRGPRSSVQRSSLKIPGRFVSCHNVLFNGYTACLPLLMDLLSVLKQLEHILVGHFSTLINR